MHKICNRFFYQGPLLRSLLKSFIQAAHHAGSLYISLTCTHPSIHSSIHLFIYYLLFILDIYYLFIYLFILTIIGSCVSVRSLRYMYEARGKVGEHERYVRVARGVAQSNTSFLSALRTSQVRHISMNAQPTHEPIVL